ncbi:LacI family DNA-binding transcriptional regulator [Streptomyces sp. HC44]|uniref:LacI family DNA-binding transcriptional regulator n=1 Tax=Streptomyces scabichelini TaxID=2711217 RepID=A0A6G4VM09_9ACTN|nr:LacI family DNA-binding transcriptional regulator [Streptomyces scabichelini]NGO15011.1 LacI family DNA-binding transcriptional regulator [Streptomyces scabichelini]
MTRGEARSGGSAAPRGVDVARLAGVSQKTVSRVFNGEQYVSAEVRRRVLQAAETLGYRLNNAARALASGRTRSIGVVALGTALYGPASLLIGIERAARDAGYALRVVNTLEGDPGGVAGAVESLLEQGVDGIVVSEPIDEGGVSLSIDVPVLVLGAPASFAGPRAVATGVGAESLARAATEHLLDLGHMTVHHIAGPQRWFAARDRLAGWRAALTARGRDQPPVIEGDWSAASGYAAGLELASGGDVTAVFAANDDMAIGLIRALTDAGLRVPGDVSVVGFDDIPVAAYVTPQLTTVRQPFDAVAQDGLRLLVQSIEKPDVELPPANDPPVDLVVRCSTAPPPRRQAQGRGRRQTASRSRGGAHAPPDADESPSVR